MKWITITSPEFLSGEATFIGKLFLQGLDLLHLRKPEASLEAYKAASSSNTRAVAQSNRSTRTFRIGRRI